MTLLELLEEYKYFKGFSGDKDQNFVIINPTTQELSKLFKEVVKMGMIRKMIRKNLSLRAFYNGDNNKLYVWDGYLESHSSIKNKLNLEGKLVYLNIWIDRVASLSDYHYPHENPVPKDIQEKAKKKLNEYGITIKKFLN